MSKVKNFLSDSFLGVLQNSCSSIKNLEEISGYEISRADWPQRWIIVSIYPKLKCKESNQFYPVVDP